MAEIDLDTIMKGAEALGGQWAEAAKKLTKELGESGVASLKEIELLKKIGFESREAFDKAVKGAKALAVTLEENFANMNFFGDATKKLSESIDASFQNIVNSGLRNYSEALNVNIDNTTELAAMSAVALAPFIGMIPPTITGLGEIGTAGIEAGQKLSKSFEPFADRLGGLGGKIGQALSGADRAYQLEQHIIGAAVAQGNFNAVLDNSHTTFGRLNEQYDEYNAMSYASAQATGQTKASMDGLLDSLKAIPGAWTESIDVGGVAMSQAVLTSKMAAGFAKSQEEVSTKLNELYTNMGSSGEKAYSSLAKIYTAASSSSRLREAFVSTVTDIAKSFNMLGDNTDAATTVVKAFDTTFSNLKISPAAIQTVISSLAEGTKKFDMARGAFISGMTGGPGGLAGGVQIEYALQTGKLDEVMAKMLRSIESQFGGGVVTLEEAAKTPELSGEYYKQLQLVTQIAGVGEREASKILDAMKAGVVGDLERGAKTEGTDALLDAVNLGTERQEVLVNNPLLKIHQTLEYTAATNNKMMLLAADQTFAAISSAMSLKTLTEDSRELAAKSGKTSIFRESSTRPDQGRIDALTELTEEMKKFLPEESWKKIEKAADRLGVMPGKKETVEIPEQKETVTVTPVTTPKVTVPTLEAPSRTVIYQPPPSTPEVSGPSVTTVPSVPATPTPKATPEPVAMPISASMPAQEKAPIQASTLTPISATPAILAASTVSVIPASTSTVVPANVQASVLPSSLTSATASTATANLKPEETYKTIKPQKGIETTPTVPTVATVPIDFSVFPSMLNVLNLGVEQLTKLTSMISPLKPETIAAASTIAPNREMQSTLTRDVTEKIVKATETKNTETTAKTEKVAVEIEPLTIKLQWPEPFEQTIQQIITARVAHQPSSQLISGVGVSVG